MQNIWNLLWLSRRLNCTEQKSMYISIFPNTLTSEWTENYDIRTVFCNKRARSLMSRTAITLKFKMRWFPDEARYLAEKL